MERRAGVGFSGVMACAIRIGTAGWSIPGAWRDRFPPDGTQLERYAARLTAAEINSSFYRPHRVGTYRRWADSVGPDFRFAVKLPKEITHRRRLADVDEPLRSFADQVAGLGAKLRVVLVQLPPSFVFDADLVAQFLSLARNRLSARLAIEPRHASWFSGPAERLLTDHAVARVAADPPPIPEAAAPGGWRGLAYFRLHGAPRIYWSDYDAEAVARHAQAALVASESSDTWVIYDNTASGAAAGNALALSALVRPEKRPV